MMLIQSAIRRYRRMNCAGGAESGIALLTALFFMVLVAGLSLVLLGVILGQTTQGYVEQKNTKTVYAAQAGLQAALGIIRSAALPADEAGAVFGDINKLPCTFSGRVDANDDGTGYSVAVKYYLEDPLGSDPGWQSTEFVQAPGDCAFASLPKYALIKSTGTGTAVPGNTSPDYGNRTLSAVYKFKVATNLNIAGGKIYNNNAQFCLSANSATTGSVINFLPAAQCSNDELQSWVYDLNYQIQLASTALNHAVGLCITGPAVDGQDTQDALLRPCLGKVDPHRWNQLWSWTGQYSWRGENSHITDQSSYCLSPGAGDGSDLTGSNLSVRNGCDGTFAPSSQVGAGPAGYGTHEIVNYAEFGRCADVTNERVDWPFMISYPCKQDPSGGPVYWNHVWHYTEPAAGSNTWTGEVYVFNHGNVAHKYCLQGPISGNDITFDPCDGSARQVWTRVYNTGDYSTSYLFVDYHGHCMATDPTTLFHGYISEIKMQVCNGSLAQKWNAPPTYDPSSFGGYREIAG